MSAKARARELIAQAVAAGRHFLEPEANELCAAFGLPLPAWRLLRTPAEAGAALAELGSPLVFKVVSPELVHKSDAGGVVLDIADAAAARAAFGRLAELGGSRGRGVLACVQAPPGLELVAGMVRDPEFGPALMFGLGGTAVELWGDVAFAPLPVDAAKARATILRTRAGRLLQGYRGPALDLEAVVAVLTRLAELAEACPQVSEVDLNPVRVYPQGALVLDARILLGP